MRCEVLEAEPGALVIAAPVTAEADYLLGQRIGQAARLAFPEDLAGRGLLWYRDNVADSARLTHLATPGGRAPRLATISGRNRGKIAATGLTRVLLRPVVVALVQRRGMLVE